MQLFGERIDEFYSEISVLDYIQKAGDNFEFILELTDSEYMNVPNAPSNFEAELSYNGAILHFADGICDNNYNCTLNINSRWDRSSNYIARFPAVATLGNIDFSDIKINKFKWVDSQLDTDIDLIDGSLTISGICEEGGVRLFHLGDVAFSMASRPQPFSNVLNIQIGLREKLQFSLLLMDINGTEIVKIVNNTIYETGKYEFNFDSSNLNQGVYYLRLVSDKGELINKIIKVD
jgi:hypothetical protein